MGVYRQTICYHVAARDIPFVLISIVTIYLKKVEFWPLSHPLGEGIDPDLRTIIPFDMFQSTVSLIACDISVKKRHLTELLQNLNI